MKLPMISAGLWWHGACSILTARGTKLKNILEHVNGSQGRSVSMQGMQCMPCFQ